jgi:hypothetical protein
MSQNGINASISGTIRAKENRNSLDAVVTEKLLIIFHIDDPHRDTVL